MATDHGRHAAAACFDLGVFRSLPECRGVLAAISAPNFTLDVLLYGIAVFGVFGALWWFYDRRDRGYYDTGRRKITFHCIRCDHLYTEPAGTETAPCPKCGHQNTRLKF